MASPGDGEERKAGFFLILRQLNIDFLKGSYLLLVVVPGFEIFGIKLGLAFPGDIVCPLQISLQSGQEFNFSGWSWTMYREEDSQLYYRQDREHPGR